jgi:thiol:disulfide interchange protein DsbC
MKIIAIFFYCLSLYSQEINNINNIDLNNTIKIGNGKEIVIEFSDPDCPNCRKSESIIKNYDVTRYIVLLPLKIHKESQQKSIHILCSENPEEEYLKTLNGELDGKKLKTCKEGKLKLEAMDKIKNNFGVQSTPVFLFDNVQMEGIKKNEISKLPLKII